MKRVFLLNAAFATAILVWFHVTYPSCVTCFWGYPNIWSVHIQEPFLIYHNIHWGWLYSDYHLVWICWRKWGSPMTWSRFEPEVSRSSCEYRNKSSGSIRGLEHLSWLLREVLFAVKLDLPLHDKNARMTGKMGGRQVWWPCADLFSS